jgi:hypothetical protein
MGLFMIVPHPKATLAVRPTQISARSLSLCRECHTRDRMYLMYYMGLFMIVPYPKATLAVRPAQTSARVLFLCRECRTRERMYLKS